MIKCILIRIRYAGLFYYSRLEMVIFGSGSSFKFHPFDPFVSEFVFGKHSSDDSSKQFCRILFHDYISSHFFEVTLVSTICIHLVILKFVSCNLDLVDILYKNEITSIPKIGIICFVFTQKQLSDINCQSSKCLPRSIYLPSFSILFHISRFYSEGLVKVFFCKFHDHYFK